MNEEEARKMLSMMAELGCDWICCLSKEELDDLVGRIVNKQYQTFAPLTL